VIEIRRIFGVMRSLNPSERLFGSSLCVHLVGSVFHKLGLAVGMQVRYAASTVSLETEQDLVSSD
jgi:hypothetical protein